MSKANKFEVGDQVLVNAVVEEVVFDEKGMPHYTLDIGGCVMIGGTAEDNLQTVF